MPRRQTLIARSIVEAVLNNPSQESTWLRRLIGLFNLYWLSLRLVEAKLFSSLRGIWGIREADYSRSFRSAHGSKDGRAKDSLVTMGDMGFSGSTFFRTSDGAYLIKSVPRSFEHNFFKNEMLMPYADHMRAQPDSLLIRITDFLACRQKSIGTLLGLAPSHHVIMENLLCDQDGLSDEGQGRKAKWETWDLKPTSYFYPERDVAGGKLTSEATKAKLADKFDDKIRLTLDQREEFKAQLQEDTRFLAACNAVDYSLFLVRISADASSDTDSQSGQTGQSSQPPFAPPEPQKWCTGLRSSDGKELYRAAVLDFFWAKHTVAAMAMEGLIRGYNLIDEQGPMTVTTSSEEYRARFLNMCLGLVEVEDEVGRLDGNKIGSPQ